MAKCKMLRAYAHDVVLGAMQFKEEWLSNLKSVELLVAARLPKVNFVQSVHAGQGLEPIPICDADVEAHNFDRVATSFRLVDV